MLLALLAWGVERLVVTDREAIEHLLERTAASVERDDWNGFASALSDEFRSQPTKQDKARFVAWAKSAWDTFGRPALRVTVREAVIDGDAAACDVRVTAAGFPAPIDARVELVRGADGWRISRLVEYSMGSFAR